MKRNWYIWSGILLLIGIAFWQTSHKEGGLSIQNVFQAETPIPTETGAKAGLLAPSFELEGLDNKETYKVGGAREKALLLNFWASWCDPCKMEAASLNKLSKNYKDQLDVYGVNVTKYDTAKEAKNFVETFKLNFPIMMDEDGAVYDLYKGMAFPTNVLIDKNGVIQEIILGILSEEELEKKVQALVNK